MQSTGVEFAVGAVQSVVTLSFSNLGFPSEQKIILILGGGYYRSINSYLHINAKSIAKGQHFSINPCSFDQSCQQILVACKYTNYVMNKRGKKSQKSII